MDSMQRFLSKLRELIRGKVKDADLSAEEFDECVRQARAHAGGMAKSDKMKAEREAATKEFAYSKLDDLPDNIKNTLPADARRVWMAAFNSTIAKTPDDEVKAIRIAWGAVKQAGWKQEGEQWVKANEVGAPTEDAIIQAMEASEMNAFKLLGEIVLSEDKSTGQVQIFPGVGKYSHSKYGELDISKEFLQAAKQNFDAKVYNQQLPITIDLEHESKLSGAAGWIKDVEIKGDRGMWATIEFNDRGKSLVSADAYRYFSPEFYDTWQDPATSEKYSNVLIGGALTNRPFFKGMQAVAMMSEGTLCFGEFAAAEADMDMQAMMSKMEDMMKMMQSMMDKGEMPEDDMQAMSATMDKMKSQMGKMKKMPGEKAAAETSGATASGASVDKGLAEKPTGGESMGLTDEEARQFKEMGDSLKSLGERLAAAETKAASEAKAREAAEAEAKQARETVAVLARDANRKTLGEFVKTNRYAFQGEVEPCIDQLEKFQTKLGEDFQAYLDERKALHERVKASGIFDQVGHNVEAPSGAMAEMEAARRKLMAEDAKLTEAQASVKVAETNPALYARYDHEFKRNIKRGGE